MSLWLLNKPGGYLEITSALLEEYKLQVSEGKTTALAKRIMFTARGIAQKAHTRRFKPRLTETADSALRHVNALLRYCIKPPKRFESKDNRRNRLRVVLQDIELILELKFATPSVDVTEILEEITANNLSTNSLESLRDSLQFILAKPRNPMGRPKDYLSFVVISALDVWLHAGREIEIKYNYGEFTGDFPNFVLGALRLCKLPELDEDEPDIDFLNALNQRMSPKELEKKAAFLGCTIHSK